MRDGTRFSPIENAVQPSYDQEEPDDGDCVTSRNNQIAAVAESSDYMCDRNSEREWDEHFI